MKDELLNAIQRDVQDLFPVDPSPLARLAELANERARHLHTTAVSNGDTLKVYPHVWKGSGDIYSGFDDCPAPDCVLVREALRAALVVPTQKLNELVDPAKDPTSKLPLNTKQ